MAPHPPDDPESGHPHPPADSGDRPEPPLHVYALDCLDQGQPPDAVRRQLVALGCSPDEARRIVDAVIARHAPASAWSPEDAPARRGMTVGFTLFVAGIATGCVRVVLHLEDTPLGTALNIVAWTALALGVGAFLLGLSKSKIRRK